MNSWQRYARCYHMALGSSNPGATGPRWVSPGAGSIGGWELDVATDILYFQTGVYSDWVGGEDLTFEVRFHVGASGSAGGTIDLKMVFYYSGVGDTATKIQTVEVATVTTGTQYKVYTATFTINWDQASNVVEVGDHIRCTLNLETDTSEIDNVVIESASMYYRTTHPGIELGDV